MSFFNSIISVCVHACMSFFHTVCVYFRRKTHTKLWHNTNKLLKQMYIFFVTLRHGVIHTMVTITLTLTTVAQLHLSTDGAAV